MTLMTYLIVRFRERAGSPEPEDAPRLGRIPMSRGHIKTVLISLILSSIVLGVLIFGTFNATNQILNVPPECAQTPSPCLNITVTAYRFAWNFTYPNGQTLVGNLIVPTGGIVVLKIVSTDVFHAFGIEGFMIKKDAIPGRPNTLWFVANQQGQDIIRCFELCGVGHAAMVARLQVMEPSEYEGWYSGLP